MRFIRSPFLCVYIPQTILIFFFGKSFVGNRNLTNIHSVKSKRTDDFLFNKKYFNEAAY